MNRLHIFCYFLSLTKCPRNITQHFDCGAAAAVAIDIQTLSFCDSTLHILPSECLLSPDTSMWSKNIRFQSHNIFTQDRQLYGLASLLWISFRSCVAFLGTFVGNSHGSHFPGFISWLPGPAWVSSMCVRVWQRWGIFQVQQIAL